jgi:uncharacterized membrane-anchored protein YitT (DUF2179 family)
MKKRKKSLLELTKTAACVVFGNMMFALAVAGFVMPNNILMGGITGIGIPINKAFGIDTAAIILGVNIVLMIAGRFVLGKKFFYSTIASSILYPVFLALFQRIPGIDKLTDNPLLAAIFAGALLGIAIGVLMRVGSSSGGTDIINLMLNKWTHIPVAILVNVLDFAIIGVQAIFAKPEQLLLGIITVVLETLVLDKVMLVGKSQIEVFVISDSYNKIRDALLNELSVGATMSVIETGLTGKRQMAVMCVIHPRKLYALTELIQNIDENAFITVTKIKEVRGQGFTRERIYRKRNDEALNQ